MGSRGESPRAGAMLALSPNYPGQRYGGVAARGGSIPGNARSFLTPGAGEPVRPAKDALLAMVRRELEALEERLNTTIARASQLGDKKREDATTRIDQKLGTIEALQPKFDRRLAEHSGNYRGVSDEMQAQIKRVDQLDGRLWEWRHALEEEINKKFSQLEQNQDHATSAHRNLETLNEDNAKKHNLRMQQLESLVQDRMMHVEEHGQGLQGLHERLMEVESLRAESIAVAPRQLLDPLEFRESAVPSSAIAALEGQLADACQRIEALQGDRHEMHVRVEAQEERMKSLRTLLDTREDKERHLTDRLERIDPDIKLREIKDAVSDIGRSHRGHVEYTQKMQKQLDDHVKVHEELGGHLRAMSAAQSPARTLEDTEGSVPNEVLAMELQDCLRRLGASEMKLHAMSADLDTAKADLDLGPRVAALVEQLKQVAPKVMDQEGVVRELHEKVGKLEVEVRMDAFSGGGPARANTVESSLKLSERLGQLELEVADMKKPGHT